MSTRSTMSASTSSLMSFVLSLLTANPAIYAAAVTGVLDRRCDRSGFPPPAFLLTVPIHIAEHGWPTDPGRSVEQQSTVLEKVVRTIHEIHTRLNVTRYTLFSLRDTDSSAKHKNDTFYHFGILRDDYSSKPAFETYRKLVEEFGIQIA